VLARDFLGAALESRLFCFQDKTPALVEIDPPGGAGAIRTVILYRALKDVCVFLCGGGGWFGSGHTQDIAKFAQEQGIVSPFLAALAALPTGYEPICPVFVL
jgi:hypothetical protein